MDILLTHGYYLYADDQELRVMRPYPALGILYISSHLKAAGFDVEVHDSTFRSPAAFEDHIARQRPSVVGIYATLMTRARVVEQMRVCKQNGAVVIVGGPEPANYAEEYLAHGADIVVVGEGERTLEELLPHLARFGLSGLDRIDGIVFAGADGAPIRTSPRAFIEDLDAQPFPDRDAIDMDAYLEAWRRHHGAGAVSLITSRGCPYTCNWCSHGVYGFTHRRRSATSVADEVELIRREYDPDLLWYADDVFTIKPSWIRDYAAELHRRGIRIPFETISREDRLDEEMIRTLAAMGCKRMWIGSESGSQRILDAMQRRTDANRVRAMVKLLQQHGIEAGMFIMLGYDGETVADIEATVEHLKAAAPDRFLTTLAYPIKGTPYYESLAGRRISTGDWSTSSDRDITVAGRHSRRFYRHASRWMINEVAWHRRGTDGSKLPGLARAYVVARAARLGMRWTRRELER